MNFHFENLSNCTLPQKFFGSTQYNFNNFCVPDLYKIKGLRVVGANSIQKEKEKRGRRR